MKTHFKKKLIYILLAIITTCIIAAWWRTSGDLLFTGQANDIFLTTSRLCGLLASGLLPLQLILIGRVKWVETVFGLDKLSRIHRTNGLIILGLILTHPLLMVFAYANINEQGVIPQFILFLTGGFGDIFWAFVGILILLATIGLSLTIVRRKLKYEWWYYVHLFNYGAIALIFLHVHEMTEASEYLAWPIFWLAIYAFTAINVLWFRFTKPVLKFWQHKFALCIIWLSIFGWSLKPERKFLKELSCLGRMRW